MINNQIIDRKFIFDLYKDKKRRRILEIKSPKIKMGLIYLKKRVLSDEFHINFIKKLQP